jgi:hypothetical protein
MKRVCVAWAKCATISPHHQLLFPDAKLAEDGVEQVFRRRFADDFATPVASGK